MFTKDYKSCMFEEICPINIYGSEIEKKMLESYISENGITIDRIIDIANTLRNRLHSQRSIETVVA